MTSHDSGRRTWLQGMLAAGCTALVPSLAGCGKEQPPETAPAEPEAASPEAAMPQPETAAPAAATPPASKVSKVDAAYQEQPKGDQQCASCQFFIAESSTCKLVEGDISPQGWCKFWAALPPAPSS